MNTDPDMITTMVKMTASLFLVLALLLTVFYFIKRMLKNDNGGPAEKPIRVLANSCIGVKKNILLVEIPGCILVVGITNDSICCLDKIKDEKILDKFKNVHGENAPFSFSDQLNRLTSRFKEEKNDTGSTGRVVETYE